MGAPATIATGRHFIITYRQPICQGENRTNIIQKIFPKFVRFANRQTE